jgi:hypothetical protein
MEATGGLTLLAHSHALAEIVEEVSSNGATCSGLPRIPPASSPAHACHSVQEIVLSAETSQVLRIDSLQIIERIGGDDRGSNPRPPT